VKKISKGLEKQGSIVYTHSHLPYKDGGVAIGLIIIANPIIGNDEDEKQHFNK